MSATVAVTRKLGFAGSKTQTPLYPFEVTVKTLVQKDVPEKR